MDIINVKGATGDYNTNLINKAGIFLLFFDSLL